MIRKLFDQVRPRPPDCSLTGARSAQPLTRRQSVCKPSGYHVPDRLNRPTPVGIYPPWLMIHVLNLERFQAD